jgi:hypothetical protein
MPVGYQTPINWGQELGRGAVATTYLQPVRELGHGHIIIDCKYNQTFEEPVNHLSPTHSLKTEEPVRSTVDTWQWHDHDESMMITSACELDVKTLWRREAQTHP